MSAQPCIDNQSTLYAAFSPAGASCISMESPTQSAGLGHQHNSTHSKKHNLQADRTSMGTGCISTSQCMFCRNRRKQCHVTSIHTAEPLLHGLIDSKDVRRQTHSRAPQTLRFPQAPAAPSHTPGRRSSPVDHHNKQPTDQPTAGTPQTTRDAGTCTESKQKPRICTNKKQQRMHSPRPAQPQLEP